MNPGSFLWESIELVLKSSDNLTRVYLMDRVQKHEPISKDAVKYLRELKVIERNVFKHRNANWVLSKSKPVI